MIGYLLNTKIKKKLIINPIVKEFKNNFILY